MPELLPGIHTIEGVAIDLVGAELAVHPVLIVEEGGLTLIDAGPVGSLGPIREYVEHLGHTVEEIERIIVTHHHSDHTGGLAALARATDAAISAHVAEVEFLDGRVPEPERPLSLEGLHALGIAIDERHYALERRRQAGYDPLAVTVAEELQGGDVLPILGGLTVLHDQGHSPGHIALFAPAHSVLFAADLFYYDGREIQVPLPIFTEDRARAVETVRAIVEAFTFDVAIPYHGVPLRERASERLRNALSAAPVSVGGPLPGQSMPRGR